MRKMKELLKKVFSLVIVTALIVTGVPTVAVYADTTVEEQEVLSDVTIGENSNETITLDETIEKEEVLEEYQQYVEDGTYDERVAFMQELEVQKSNRLPKATANVSKEGATAEQSQTMPGSDFMPSTGDVKALVFLVDFPDMKQTDGTTAESRKEELFDLDDVNSFSGFYYASSYGQLRLDGDVYGYYTTENVREYYNDGAIGRQELINELLGFYDDVIDYSNYDADKDGIIDALYIDYVGADTGWGSFWWTYVGYWSETFVPIVEADGMAINSYAWMNAQQYGLEKTYKHETGHLLGLMDYYDSINGVGDASIGTFDMMWQNEGDHNAYSKMLLGWLELSEVSDATELELRSSQLYPEAAIIYPNKDTTSDEFFVIEFITGDGANFYKEDVVDDGGIRVWRINAKVDESGNFIYRNIKGSIKFIESVGICNMSYYESTNGNVRVLDAAGQIHRANIYFEGDELTPYSNPSSYIHGEKRDDFSPLESDGGPFETSGIVMDNIHIEGGKAKVNISYDFTEKEDFEYSMEYTFESMLLAELTFDYETTLLDASKISVSNGETELEIIPELNYVPDYGYKKLYIFSKDTELTESGVFNLTIEEGALINVFGNYNPVITDELVVSSVNDEIAKVYDVDFGYYNTDIILIGDKGYVFYEYNNAIWLSEIYQEGSSIETQETKILECPNNPYLYAHAIGNHLLLQVHMWSGTTYWYKVDTAGNCILLLEETREGHPNRYILGENCLIYDGTENMRLLMTATGEVKEIVTESTWALGSLWELGQGLYLTEYEKKMVVVDAEFNIMRELTRDSLGLSSTERIADFTEKDGKLLMITTDENGGDADLSMTYLDEDYNVVCKTKFLSNSFFNILYNDLGLIEYKNGYAIRMQDTDSTLMRFSNTFSPNGDGYVWEIAKLAFYDDNMKYVSSKFFWARAMDKISFAEIGDKYVYMVPKEKLYLYELGEIYAENKEQEIKEVSLDRKNVTLSVGTTYRLREIYEPYDILATIDWSSSNEEVAIVDSNGYVTAVSAGETTITATVNGVSASCEIKVNERDMPASVDISEYEVLEIEDQTYTGYAIIPDVTVKYLVEGTDYIIAGYSDNMNVGTATILLEGIGHYTGTKYVTFEIVPKGFSNVTIEEIVTQNYTGVAITPSITVTDGDATLVKDTDYTVSYSNNVNVGTATVTITGKGNYSGTKEVTFTIVSKSLANLTVLEIVNQTFTGSAITPSIIVTDGDTTLVKDTDYTVSYSNNVNVGTATVTITGIGNYSGTKEVTFTIVSKSLANATVSSITNQTYTGSAITPSVTVKDGDTTLVKDIDYTVSYSNNINAGTATVTITGIGNYSGTKDVTFEITEKTLTNATVSAIANQTYTGNVITPGVTVTDGNKTLVKDTDYTVSYSNNVNTGTATVTITGKGNYSGTKEVTFTIVSKSLANATVSSIVNQTYTGSAITPSITVTDGNKTLVKDTDYTVSYSNNVNAGTATVTITGIGNYSGTKEVTFTIVSKSLANATVSSITNQTYTGSAITPSVTVKDGSKTLVKDTDYTVSYSNNVNAGTATVIITGKGNYTGTRTLNFTIVKKEEPKPQVPTQITSPSVSVNQSAGSISKITIGTSVQSFRASLNEKNYVKVYQNNQVVSDSVVLATGMEARVMDGNTVVKKYSIIVTGDTNGDGKMNITDMIAIKANILKKTFLNGVYEDAADVNGDGKINVTDFIKIKAALLKKDSIVGVAVK